MFILVLTCLLIYTATASFKVGLIEGAHYEYEREYIKEYIRQVKGISDVIFVEVVKEEVERCFSNNTC